MLQRTLDHPAPSPWHRLLVEHPRPVAISRRPNAYWYAVITVCFGAFMGQLDASIVTLAFPTMERSLHATSASVTWVGLSYLLALVAILPAVGRYADMLGRKLFYTYGFVLFIVGSALCGLAPSLGILIGFRIIQGLGAAMLQANSVAIIANATPRAKLGQAIGVQGAAQALGLALGPAVGGLLIALAGWRLIFFVNVPVGLAATVLAWFLVPRSRNLAKRTTFDWTGIGILIPTVVALLLAFSFGDQYGWLSAEILGCLAAAAVGAALFIFWELRARFPVLPLSYFRRTAFAAGVSSGWLMYLVIFGVLYVVPYLLERGLGFSVARTGVELLVMPLALGAIAPFAGKLADRVGARPLLLAGMGLTTVMLVALAVSHGTVLLFLVELALLGVGLGLSVSPNNASTIGALPQSASGVASGVLNMARGLGTAMGLALTALVFGLFAGPHAAVASSVKTGFEYAALFLAAAAALTVVISAIRDNSQLSSDPSARVE